MPSTRPPSVPRDLPLIDLHLHLEGSLPRRTIAALAARHRLPAPPVSRFVDFQGFLRAFGALCDLLVDVEDFERATRDVLVDARRRGLVHVEVLFSPQVFLRRGIALGTIMGGLERGRRRALRGSRMSVVFIADGVRQWGGEWFEELVRGITSYAGGLVGGVGLGGDESALGSRVFRRAFDLARRAGLRTTVHSGEACGPEAMWDVLRHIAPDRIGHGVRAAEDPDLTLLLARRGMTLEMCPSSNVLTGAVASLREHPIRSLIRAGVPVTINSDDGTFFRTDVRTELGRVMRACGFGRADVRDMMLNAARAAFVSPGRRRLLERSVRRARVSDAGRRQPRA